MLRIKNNNTIYLTRGDTANIDINIFYEDSAEPYVPQSTDVIKFSVKKDVNDSSYVFQKTATVSNGVATVNIVPSDTSGKDYGEYVYDVQLTQSDGSVYTVVPYSKFRLTEEVTTS